MFKKIVFPLILALVAALALGGVAYAASQPAEALTPVGTTRASPLQASSRPGPNTADNVAAATLARRHGLGQITVIGEDQFTVQLKSGAEKVIRVDEQTRYQHADGSQASFTDLQVGRWVAGRVVASPDGPLARRVILLPEGFDPPVRLIRHAGTIETIDASSFTIRGRDGNTRTFQVTPETRFRSRGGQVKGLSDLRLGMGVGVAARQADDGQLVAMVVIIVR